ncbi:MAG: cell division protein FtsQ/DivIB [Pseudomonadota bacterium]
MSVANGHFLEREMTGAKLGSLVFLTVIALCVVALILFLNRPLVASVEGNYERVNELDVLARVEGFLNAGLLGVDLDQVQRNVEALPWVDRVRVQRRWPNRLVLRVTEHVAAARWGDTGLLNTRGEVFVNNARHIPSELPLLSGPEGSEWQVAQRYMEIRGNLIQTGLGLTQITLSPRGAWRVVLANDIEVRFGREQFAQRLDRFIRFAAPMMLKHENQISYIDLRYGNGFSVGWNDNGMAERMVEVNPDG